MFRGSCASCESKRKPALFEDVPLLRMRRPRDAAQITYELTLVGEDEALSEGPKHFPRMLVTLISGRFLVDLSEICVCMIARGTVIRIFP